MIITIDGPTASGKSSTAKALAKKLGFYYLNSGLMYRAMAWIAQNLNWEDAEEIPFQYAMEDGEPRILIGQDDITDKLFTSEIAKLASIMSQQPELREFLDDYQRSFAEENDLVVEGRDAGTAVFPNADLKIFLTASDEVRARRWLSDAKRKHQKTSLEDAIAAIKERDKRDSERQLHPLKIAEGATVIDNSDLSMDQVVQQIVAMVS